MSPAGPVGGNEGDRGDLDTAEGREASLSPITVSRPSCPPVGACREEE